MQLTSLGHWADSAVVHVVCALPLAWIIARRLRSSLSFGAMCVLAGTVLALGLAVVALDLLAPTRASLPQFAFAARGLAALAALLGPVLMLAVFSAKRPAQPTKLSAGLVFVGIWLLPPATYVNARCRHDRIRFGDYLEQSRIAEARQLVLGLLALDPYGQWQGRSLDLVAEEIGRAVAQLEASVARPVPPGADAGERRERARRLAMLGRTREALRAAQDLDDAETANLRGTIHEARGDWTNGLNCFQDAHAAWARQPPSQHQAAGTVRALTGMAYCHRKLGHYAEAEAAYLKVLALAPGAESHFLLARFYDDCQVADSARYHARQAMALDPARYRNEGLQIINKLSENHFGCLAIYQAENKSTSGGLAFP